MARLGAVAARAPCKAAKRDRLRAMSIAEIGGTRVALIAQRPLLRRGQRRRRRMAITPKVLSLPGTRRSREPVPKDEGAAKTFADHTRT